VPAVLHTHRESRAEGLKFYKLFESDKFESKYVNLEIDILQFSHCHHSSRSPVNAGIYLRGVTGVQLANIYSSVQVHGSVFRSTDYTIIGVLAAKKEDVKNITSLAICQCQVEDAWGSNRPLCLETLKKYEKLRERVFTNIGTRDFVESLGSDGSDSGDGVADMLRHRPARPEWLVVNPEDDKAKRTMWDIMKSAVDFKNFLKRGDRRSMGCPICQMCGCDRWRGGLEADYRHRFDGEWGYQSVPTFHQFWVYISSSARRGRNFRQRSSKLTSSTALSPTTPMQPQAKPRRPSNIVRGKKTTLIVNVE
jgi:hypothetical protein